MCERIRQREIRKIFTKEQREFFASRSNEFSMREWALIMNTDSTGINRLKARYNVRLRHKFNEEYSPNDLLKVRQEFECMDWDRQISKVVREKVKKIEDKKLIKAKINLAKQHDPDAVQERLKLNGMVITWGEYVERLMYQL